MLDRRTLQLNNVELFVYVYLSENGHYDRNNGTCELCKRINKFEHNYDIFSMKINKLYSSFSIGNHKLIF